MFVEFSEAKQVIWCRPNQKRCTLEPPSWKEGFSWVSAAILASHTFLCDLISADLDGSTKIRMSSWWRWRWRGFTTCEQSHVGRQPFLGSPRERDPSRCHCVWGDAIRGEQTPRSNWSLGKELIQIPRAPGSLKLIAIAMSLRIKY